MNRRTFPKSAAAASVATLLRPSWAEAALPQAKIIRIRFYEAPNVMPLADPASAKASRLDGSQFTW